VGGWAAHGYRKLYQPRSILIFGAVFTLVFSTLRLTIFWFAGHRGLP